MNIQILYTNILDFLYSISLTGTYVWKIISFSFFFSLRILGSNCRYMNMKDKEHKLAFFSFFFSIEGMGLCCCSQTDLSLVPEMNTGE